MLVSGSITNPTLLNQDKANPAPVVASVSPITTKVEAKSSKVSSSKLNTGPKSNNNLGVEEAVREYFADIPLMAEISKCESRFRQFDTSGDSLRGKVNSNDVGALQVNETYHLKRSKKLGYDIHSLQGNMAYARLLYEESGPQPWSPSYPCWGNSPLAANFKPRTRAMVTTTAVPVTVNTDIGVAVTANTSVVNTNTSLIADTHVSAVAPIVTGTVSVLADR